MVNFYSTKLIELGSCAFRQWKATHSHCQYLHGYQLKAKFVFGCKKLDDKNWCVDFGGLKELKRVLNDQFDHKTCVAADDPLLEDIKSLSQKGGCVVKVMDGVGIEKIAEFCFNVASKIIEESYGDRCWVESVEVFEHEANTSIYKK
jgi:6-pyruvoyltetrahydropterin/6-carboxytetrahydropterin synthase